MITANRYHDICCGHRVFGHENKCAHLHGHNYRFHFNIAAVVHNDSQHEQQELDSIGRVIDFSVIKAALCEWLEENFDHKFLVWEKDPIAPMLVEQDPKGVVVTSFNPTAENIAVYFVQEIAPKQLHGKGVRLVECTIEETRKCSVTYKI